MEEEEDDEVKATNTQFYNIYCNYVVNMYNHFIL